MFSGSWPLWLSLTIKVLAGAAGIGAGAAGLRAAWLWLKASKITIPEMEMPQASVEDAPALWDYTVTGGVIEAHNAFARSSELNAGAARWAAAAAVLTGFAGLLGAL